MDKPNIREFFAALNAPVAPFSWELTAALPGDEEMTSHVKAEFGRPVTILGFYPEVIANSSDEDLIDPQIKDIQVELNTNGDRRYTAQRSERGNVGHGSVFAALGSLSVLAPRLVMIELHEGAPDLAVRLKWKRWQSEFSETPIYNDALITLTMFCFFPPKA